MSNDNHAIIVIPARFHSTRFPGKPLTLIHGITMIERVWRISQECRYVSDVYIATDSIEIATHAKSFKAKVLLESSDCLTGSERIFKACKEIASDETILIGLQGDAVLTPPWVIDDMVKALQKNETTMVTPAVKLEANALQRFLEHKKVSPSSGTSVVFDKNHNALYFSKHPLPFLYPTKTPNLTPAIYRHIGLYGYRYKTLKMLQTFVPSALEQYEKLEQLRALENGIPIKVVVVDYQGRSHGSVDTPEDVKIIEEIINEEGELIPCLATKLCV